MAHQSPISNLARSAESPNLQPHLDEISARHKHLCPRIVLGARIGLFGLKYLGLENSFIRYTNSKKQLFTIVEIDGCGADGICTAVDCSLVRRTMKHVDYGKLAATFINRKTNQAVRVAPSPDARALAQTYAPNAKSRWHAYLDAYQIIPDDLLLVAKPVTLTTPLADFISRAGVRVNCATCGEEIVNEREVLLDGKAVCRSCADGGYYY